MKRSYIFAALAAMMLCACAKVTVFPPDPSPEPVDPVGPVEDCIIFDPAPSAMSRETTKGPISADDFKTSGNRLHVYDFLTYDYTQYIEYLNEEIYSDGAKWNLQSGKEYEWTRTGTHAFLGWFINDANVTPNLPQSMFGMKGSDKPDLRNYSLSLPEYEMTATSEQFDFMFSDVIVRTMQAEETDDHSPVRLSMRHLFTSFGLGAENQTNRTIKIKEVSVRNLTNVQRAVISFDKTGADSTRVAYTPASSSRTFNFHSSAEVDIQPGGKAHDILNGTSHASYETNYLMWPQSVEQLSLVEVTIIYSFDNEPDAPDLTFKIPQKMWKSGVVNHIDIVFAEKMIEARVVVKPWDKTDTDVNFNDGAVRIKNYGELTVDDENCYKQDESIIFTGTQPVTCRFTLEAPAGATWMVSARGDFDAFEIIDGVGTIDGTEAVFQVKPLILNAHRDYTMRLNFTVRLPDGRSVPANTQVLLIDYLFILPKNS